MVALAKSIAKEKGLEQALVCAVIEQESDWDPWVPRYEPAFDRRYLVPMHLRPTSEVLRAMSWGLMQVMGETAVEVGLEECPTHLIEPAIGLEVGCAVLARDFRDAGGHAREALLRWNGGRDSLYPDQVMARIKLYQG